MSDQERDTRDANYQDCRYLIPGGGRCPQIEVGDAGEEWCNAYYDASWECPRGLPASDKEVAKAWELPDVFFPREVCEAMCFSNIATTDAVKRERVKRVIRSGKVERAAIAMLYHLDRLTLSARGNADFSMSMTVKSGEWGHLRDLVVSTRALLGKDQT